MSEHAGKTRPSKLRPHQMRSRRIVLGTFGIFALLQLGGGLLLDHVWPRIRFPMMEAHCHNVQTLPQPPEILFLGSSRLGMAVDCARVTKLLHDAGVDRPVQAFNGSVSAGDLVSSEYVLHQLSHAGAHPSLVVLEISPETVAYYNCWIRDHTFRQLTWRDSPQGFVNVCARGQLGNYISTRLLPLYVHRYQIMKNYQNACASALTPPHRAVTALSASRSQEPTAAKEASHIVDPVKTLSENLNRPGVVPNRTPGKDVTKWLSNYRAGGGISESALVRILNRCQKRGIQVLLVGIPVAPDHFSRYTPAVESAYQAFIDRIVGEYSCQYVDYRNAVPEEYFVDHHHLSLAGQRVFTHLLTENVLAPRWSRLQVSRSE